MNAIDGNILYAEFTDVTKWDFHHINFWEYFDMDKDPYQLQVIFMYSEQGTVSAQGLLISCEGG